MVVVRIKQLQRTYGETRNDGPPPKHICEASGRCKDVLINELPQELSPIRKINYKNKMIPGSGPPSKAPYRLNQKELLELKMQFIGLLSKGYIRPSKSPYGALVLFVDKKNGKQHMYIDYRA